MYNIFFFSKNYIFINLLSDYHTIVIHFIDTFSYYYNIFYQPYHKFEVCLKYLFSIIINFAKIQGHNKFISVTIKENIVILMNTIN